MFRSGDVRTLAEPPCLICGQPLKE
jgi:hypothetical protein